MRGTTTLGAGERISGRATGTSSAGIVVEVVEVESVDIEVVDVELEDESETVVVVVPPGDDVVVVGASIGT